jgi:hypothetical protein
LPAFCFVSAVQVFPAESVTVTFAVEPVYHDTDTTIRFAPVVFTAGVVAELAPVEPTIWAMGK